MNPDERRGTDGDAPVPHSPTDDSRDLLVTEHLALARHLAQRFSGRGEPDDDLFQVASLALVKAADRFDRDRGVAFSTFATATIVGELKHHLRDAAWSVRAPRRLQELYLEVSARIGDLTQALGRSPTIHEIGVACGRSDEDVLAAIEAGHAYRADSLDVPGAEETLPIDSQHDAASSADSTFAEQIECLEPRLQLVVRLRFVDELSQSEIAQQLGISQMHVSRLLRDALDTLRRVRRDG